MSVAELRGRRVLVTGGTGFIGSHLVRALVRAECEVAVLTRPQSDWWRLTDVAEHVTAIHGDLADFASLQQLDPAWFSGVVFHLASAGVAQTAQNGPLLATANVGGTVALLQKAAEAQAERFIYCGSCFEYGEGENLTEASILNPTSMYGASKAAATILTQTFGRTKDLTTVVLRPFTVFGPFEGVNRLIPYTILSALQGRTINLTGGEQTRDFVFVKDAVSAFLQASVIEKVNGEIFNICTGQAVTVKAVATKIIEFIDRPVNLHLGAIPYRDTEMWRLSGNPNHSQKRINWRPNFSLQEGLQQTIDWFGQNSHLPHYV